MHAHKGRPGALAFAPHSVWRTGVAVDELDDSGVYARHVHALSVMCLRLGVGRQLMHREGHRKRGARSSCVLRT